MTSYSDVIRNIEVKRFRRDGARYEIRAVLFIEDGSELHFKEYLFEDGTKKYSYHWQTEDGKIIGRWDNSPHWHNIKTFPHHFHNKSEDQIEESYIRNLESLLEYLRNKLRLKD